ncbi:hypothetical protein [Aquabacterium sp.]|uniref:hypothetical protein n=1 Tax=Aquabacterium sp. TaxID=1872578 RepID=UPI002BFD878F|nr:hypothetical protein [Aquabacterium sp.]HSW06930.1 hypothetical protein [Aquabacterium sp.]
MNTPPVSPRDGNGPGSATPDSTNAQTRQRSGHDGTVPAAATPDAAAIPLFEALLEDGDELRPPEVLPSPMALFSRLPEPAPAQEPAAPPPESPGTTLALRIETLAISTGQDGHRRVRLSVADNALPDTLVELGHEHGELQVVFFCRRPEGRVALAAQAPQLADTLARRLQQVVSVSVGGTQRDEPGRVTVQAQPGAVHEARGDA